MTRDEALAVMSRCRADIADSDTVAFDMALHALTQSQNITIAVDEQSINAIGRDVSRLLKHLGCPGEVGGDAAEITKLHREVEFLRNWCNKEREGAGLEAVDWGGETPSKQVKAYESLLVAAEEIAVVISGADPELEMTDDEERAVERLVSAIKEVRAGR